MRELLARGMTLTQIGRESEEMARLALAFQYDFAMWGERPQPSAVARFLDECRRLVERFPEQLPRWPARSVAYAETISVSEDPGVVEQLRAIGTYSVTRAAGAITIEWDSVPALDNELGSLRLKFRFEGEFPPALLAAWATVRDRFSTALQSMRQELLERARADAPRAKDDDARLLSEVNRGILTIASDPLEPTGYTVECWWDVEWDPEHGCNFAIDADGNVRRAD